MSRLSGTNYTFELVTKKSDHQLVGKNHPVFFRSRVTFYFCVLRFFEQT